MTLPSGLEALLRAAWASGRNNEALNDALERIERMDVPQKGTYGQASADALNVVRRALDTCPKCGHRAHGRACYNLASDNDCSCTYDPAGEWIDTIEMGDRLTAIAGLSDSIPEPHSIRGRVVTFTEGDFVINTVTYVDGEIHAELQDRKSYEQKRRVCACEWDAIPPNIACPIHREKP